MFKKHSKLLQELNLMFSISRSYTKHRNNKQERYVKAFIDVDSAKNKFSHRILRFIHFCGDLISLNREKKIFGEDLISRMRGQFTEFLKISKYPSKDVL